MPIKARRHIRKMRGGAQSHLIEGDDGHFYVVKFLNNPQHRRILINELVCSVFLRYLQISSPETALIEFTPEFLEENPEVVINLGSQSIRAVAGRHFGSRFPGDPAKLAVYDFLPDVLLAQVNNLSDFRGCLVFDKWVGNADARQSIFYRARLRDWGSSSPPLKLGFVAMMIDHGFAFNGPHWDFPDSPMQGLYMRKVVYETVRSLDDFQPWLEQVVHFPEEVIDEAYRQAPPEWLAGEEEAFEKLLERLLRRRKRVPDLLEDCRKAKSNPFTKWT
jgi:HipA-like protein